MLAGVPVLKTIAETKARCRLLHAPKECSTVGRNRPPFYKPLSLVSVTTLCGGLLTELGGLFVLGPRLSIQYLSLRQDPSNRFPAGLALTALPTHDCGELHFATAVCVCSADCSQGGAALSQAAYVPELPA